MFLDFNKSLRQNSHQTTDIKQSQPKLSSRKNVNITSLVLFTIQFHFICHTVQVSHVKCYVLFFSLTGLAYNFQYPFITCSHDLFNKLQ